MAADTVFYPSLSSLLPLDAVPANLGFVQGVLHDIFDNLYYRDLQVQKSRFGDVGYYQLSLMIYKKFGFEIPGTGGAALVLNSAPPPPPTEFAIAIGYRWEILKYINAFDPSALTELPRLLFGAFIEAAGAGPAELLAELIAQLYGSAADPVQAFVDAYNLDNLPAPPLSKLNSSNPDAVIADLLAQFDSVQQVDVYEVLIGAFLGAAAPIDDIFARISAFFAKWVKDLSAEDFKAFLIPHCALAIKNINLALEFPRSLLKPVDINGDVIDANSTAPEDQKQKSKLTFIAGSLRYSTDSGLGFDALNTFAFSPSQIGDTGVTLAFSGMKLDLSRTTNIPEATADGRPPDFVGAYIQSAQIGLPKKWFSASSNNAPGPSIVGSNIIIGSGGLSGKIGLNAAGAFHTKLGNFEAALTSFDIRFERNSIVESNIAGSLSLKGFKDSPSSSNDAVIAITAHIAEDGDFSVTATENPGVHLFIPGVMDFEVNMLGFGRGDGRFFVETGGTITFLFNIPMLSFDRPIAVDIKKLIVWDNGKFEIQGGAIVLPKALTLKIGPVKLSVTAISMGSYEKGGRPYKYFGFDGGVNVNPGGVDARANGVKVYWRADAASIQDLDIFVRIEGIAIDIVIPGGKSAEEATVLISGFLQVKEPDPAVPGSGTEYAGGVSVKLPKAGIGGSAAMRLSPSVPAFIVDTEISISVPIPLGNTSLGIYGFRGMLGLRYVADRSYAPLNLAADADWYQFYKAKVPPAYKEGVDVGKFAPRKGFAVGAGLTLGTLTDSGKAFSAKLFALLSLPDVFVLQGQAAIVGERVDLRPDDPPFSVFITVSKHSVEAAFGVAYKLPQDSGAILDLEALIEMGFFFDDASAWYINAGRDLPASKRVTARLFTLFDAWSYLMLSASGIKAGAGVTWDFNKGFGPIHLEAHVFLDTQGRIAFKPPQIGAAILLGGSAAIKVFKFKLGVSLAAGLAAEAPKPFIITGSVDVSVDLPRPFRKFGGTVTLHFTWTFDSSLDTVRAHIFNEDDIGEAARSVNIVTRERYALNVAGGSAVNQALPPPPTQGWSGNFADFVVPLDASIDIEFKKPIAPSASVTNIGITGTGYDNVELVPPQKGKSPQVHHSYVVDEVKIRSWNPHTLQWADYDIYAALTPLQHAAFVDPNDLAGLKQGWWQLDKPGRINKLSLLTQTPLSYAGDIPGAFVPENSGITTETIFCAEAPIPEHCIVADEFPDLKLVTAGRRYTLKDIQARLTGADAPVGPFLNPFGLSNGLALKPDAQLELFFPEATGHVVLRLATLADDVTILYQQRRQTGVNSSRQPVYGYVTVKRDVLDAAHLLHPVVYDAPATPIDKVVIVAGRCTCLEGLTAATPSKAQAQWPQPNMAVLPPHVPPPACGSLAAYGANLASQTQRELDALKARYLKLLADAARDDALAARLDASKGRDRALATKYRRDASDLRAQAAALKDSIAALTAFAACLGTLGGGGGAAALPLMAAPVAGAVVRPRFPCNIDPRFDYTCLTFVFGVCWLPLGSQLYNNTIPSFADVLASNTAMATAINNTIHPIWRPDTTYAVSIRTTDTVSVPERSINSAVPVYMHFGFSTRGGIGHFAQYRNEYLTLAAQDRGDQFRLLSLKPFIDYAKCYPNADGNVLNSKPLFYKNPKLQVFYTQPYIYTMFGGRFDAYNGNLAVTSTLDVSILDPVNPLPASASDAGFVPPVSAVFAANALGRSGRDVQILNAMATQGNPCTGIGAIKPIGIQSNVTVSQLKPLKLYLAVFKANHNGNAAEVHRFNFQTSRFGDFAEQVASYRLTDRDGVYRKDALYDDIAVTLDATRHGQLAALLAHNYPSGDPLEREYADPFDRLMDGILRTGPLDPPVGTDFNVVRDAANHKVIGILVRNPEPFNDPKIPAAAIAGTIALVQHNAPPKTFTVLHSKDRSKAFIGDPGLDLALHDLYFTFTYLEYDGAAYTAASVATVNLLVTP